MTLTWLGDRVFAVDGIEFVYSFDEPSTPRRFSIRKPKPLVEATIGLLEEFGSARMVELGIASGGSTALLATAGSPEKLVALELADERISALDALIDDRALAGCVRPYYGVDQADRERVVAIVDGEFDRDRLDLVIDDASHRYAETLASFEMLFPRLRAGGAYVIEDWSWQLHLAYAISKGTHRAGAGAPPAPEGEPDDVHRRVAEYARQNASSPPLERLVLEVVLARACSDDLIGDVTITESQVVVRRGSRELDPQTFRLADAFVAAAGVMR